MPALPLDEAGKYVAGAYVVFLVLILVYVAIMATKLQRIERELSQLAGFAEQGAIRDRATAGAEDGGREEQRPSAGAEAGSIPGEEAARV